MERWGFNNSYQQLSESMYSRVNPTKVVAPKLILYNEKLAQEIGLEFDAVASKLKAEYFSGNLIPPGAEPMAQAYAGHQFGHFNILGDGRAILWGEMVTPHGSRVDVQLKGSGPTPYSRRGDGRATLRSMLREYLMSEAMHGLGIASTRSIAVVATGEQVYREAVQDGAVLTRVAASHIRVGTFEYARHFLSKDAFASFTNYTIQRHYPELINQVNPVLEFLRKVMMKQIELIVHWMRVGFIHGVMNTDNMSIAGETIDYGPCAFMNAYRAQTVFSSIDTNGRYAYANQPQIALWNVSCFAGTILPLIHQEEAIAIKMAEEVLNSFQGEYEQQYAAMMAKKIGFLHLGEGVLALVEALMEWMQLNQADYTNSFLAIQNGSEKWGEMYQQQAFKEWQLKRAYLLEKNGVSKEQAAAIMQMHNPSVIPRNHLVEKALDAACMGHDYSYFNKLLERLQCPYKATTTELSEFQQPPEGGDQDYATYCGT